MHCADCGQIKAIQEAHNWTISEDPKYLKCALCNHLKLKTGGGGITPVFPSKKDPEEETE